MHTKKTYIAALSALPVCLEVLSGDLTLELNRHLAAEPDEDTASSVLEMLPTGLPVMRQKLVPSQIVAFISYVATAFQGSVSETFGMVGALQEHFSYDRILDFLVEVRNNVDDVSFMFDGLVDVEGLEESLRACAAIVSPRQLDDVYMTIFENCGGWIPEALTSLGSAVELLLGKLPSEKIGPFLKNIVISAGTETAEAFDALPRLSATMSFENVYDIVIVPCEADELKKLSPAGRATVSLFHRMLKERGELNPDLAIEGLVAELIKEGDRARASGMPTIGGKIGGDREDFDGELFPVLELLGVEVRNEIIGEGASAHRMLVLPAARSSYEATLMIDLLREVGVFRNGATLRHQITLSGELEEEAKHIALALHSAQPFPVPYPERLPQYAGFDTVAPIAEGGGVLYDINGTMNGSDDRFDIPLMRIFTLDDPMGVVEGAADKDEDDRTLMEEVLLQLHRRTEALWAQLPREQTLHGVPDEALQFVMVAEKDGNGVVVPMEMQRPDLDEHFVRALEGAFGDDLEDIRSNHSFTIVAAQFLGWAMKSAEGTPQREIYDRFRGRMRKLYREAGIEDVLDTRWVGKKWDAIYPSLARFEEAETPAFRSQMKALLNDTIGQLRKLIYAP